MKTQVWLRPDQHELVIDCLRFAKERLNEGTVLSEAHKMAGRFVYRRIDELLQQIEKKTPNVKVTGSPALSASPSGLPGSAAGDNEERDGNE